MHEVSWRRVKWPRPSWVRKDLLSVCGIVLGSIAVSQQYLLACCGGLLEASSAPLGGPLGASGRAPGADFGPLDMPWAAPKSLSAEKREFVDRMAFFEVFAWRLPRSSWGSLGGPWGLLRPSWRLLGGPWAVLSGSWVALGRAQWVPGGSWVALPSSLSGPGVAATTKAPRTRTCSLYRYTLFYEES